METPVEEIKEPRKGTSKKQSVKSSAPKPKQSDVLEKMLAKMEKQLAGEKAKASVGDYIRLRQYRDERLTEEAKEIRVTWVEPNEKESVTET